MAKLPTREELSQPGSLRSGRMISSADTSAIGRGLEALGSGVQQFAEERRRQGVVLDGATADGTSTRALNDLERSFDQRSDYDKFGDSWQKGFNQIVAQGAAKIGDPNARAVWTQQMAARAEPWRNRVMNLAQTRITETRRESAVTALEGFQSVIADNNAAEDARNAAKRDADVWISGLQETGILTPSQAADWREKVIRGGDFLYGEREIMAKGSEAISGALPRTTAARATTAMQFFASRGYTKEQAAGIVGNLIAESNLRPSGAVGDNGTAFGIAQWRGERLTRLKRYAASQGKDWQDFETQLSFVDVELQSHETNAYKALKNAKTIDEATAAFIGYERPAGWSTGNPRGGHNYSGRLKSAAQAAGENIPPEWFRNLPADKQFDLETRAAARDDQMDREAAAQSKFAQEQAKDQYSLRIASEDLSLSRETIMADAVLDDGQKATLLNSYDAKFKELRATADAMQAFAAGNLRVDPFASDGKKVVDNLFDAAVKDSPDRIQPLTEELVRQTGVVPNSAMSLIRQGLVSTNITDVANAAQAAQRISTINPDVLGRRDGGGEVQTAADDFSFYVNKMNLTPEEAARRIIDSRSPENKFTRKAMEGAAKEFVKAVEKEDIAAIFDDSWFSDPVIGFNEGQRLGIQAEYVAIAEDQFYAANGDPELAKNRAAEQMKRLYGVTDMTGRKVVMKHPPERYWPKSAQGTSSFTSMAPGAPAFDYAKNQLEADIKALDPNADLSSVQFVTTLGTDAQVKRGEMPGYAVMWKDANGNYQTIPGKLWRPDFKKPAQFDQQLNEVQTQRARENQVQERQKAPYNVQKQDDFLSGEDPLFGPR